MSQTRSSKREASVQREEQTISDVSTSETMPNVKSPILRHVTSRLQEKKELQHLNDRLAQYIDAVRHLEHENLRLSTQMRSVNETHIEEISKTKNIYQQEIDSLRNALEDIADAKARAEIDRDKCKQEANELNNRVEKQDKKLNTLQKQLNELRNRLEDAETARKQAENDLKDVDNERNTLTTQVMVARQQLEAETMGRVELENRLQSLKEQLEFQQQLNEQQTNQSMAYSRQAIEEEITKEIQEIYESTMSDELKELRAESERKTRIYRDELKKKYEHQLKEHNSSLNALNSRIKDLENIIEQERNWHRNSIEEKEKEINNLRDQMTTMVEDYQDLLDAKVALDLEIATYRKLLEEEETRLNLSNELSQSVIKSASSPRTPGRRRKRVLHEDEVINIDVNSTSDGDVLIEDFDSEGKFVKLHNKGETNMSLGGWQIVKSSGNEAVTYKFGRSFVLKGNHSVTVYSTGSGTHNPPNEIVMKDRVWCSGEEANVSLITNNSIETAKRSTVKTVSRKKSRFDELIGEHEDTKEKCLVM